MNVRADAVVELFLAPRQVVREHLRSLERPADARDAGGASSE